MFRPIRSLENVLEAVLVLGQVQLRAAHMEPGRRYKIDTRDPACVVVYLNRSLTPRQHLGAFDAISEHLAQLARTTRRLALSPVAELEVDEDAPPAATGTDGPAWPRPSLEVVAEDTA